MTNDFRMMDDCIYFSVPLRWNAQYVRAMTAVSHPEKTKLAAFYGCINMPGFCSGRIPLDHQSVSLDEASSIVRLVHDKGRRFFYLFNAPIVNGVESLDCGLLDEIIQATDCDAVVVADLCLAELIRSRHEGVAVHVSTVADIKCKEDLARWYCVKPERLVLHHDLPRLPGTLGHMIEDLHEHGVKPEMMVTESCLFKCPYRSRHYHALGEGRDDRMFHERCRSVRKASPDTILSCGSFVRPQDVRMFYDKYRIKHFKITGRSQSADWLMRAASAYLNEKFSGNLVELMGMDPSIFPEKKFSLNSEILDGYVERLFDVGDDGANEMLARAWLTRMGKNTE